MGLFYYPPGHFFFKAHAHTSHTLYPVSYNIVTLFICVASREKKQIHEQAEKAKGGSKIKEMNDGQWTSVFFVVIYTCGSQCRGHVPVTGVSEL